MAEGPPEVLGVLDPEHLGRVQVLLVVFGASLTSNTLAASWVSSAWSETSSLFTGAVLFVVALISDGPGRVRGRHGVVRGLLPDGAAVFLVALNSNALAAFLMAPISKTLVVAETSRLLS